MCEGAWSRGAAQNVLLLLGLVVPLSAISGLNACARAEAESWFCPTEPGPGTVITRASLGGGMAGVGWDGIGQGSVELTWHVGSMTPDIGLAQRTALIDAMQTWSNIVEVSFRELPVPNVEAQVVWQFFSGDHCASDPAECGQPDCPFDGAGGTLAHAGFPPGIPTNCPLISTETRAGDVHFDEAETWEQDAEGGAGNFSLTLVAAHEVGHAIGLTHDGGPGGPHIMRPSASASDVMISPSASDIANVRTEYAAGTGSVITLEMTGVWVDASVVGNESGTQEEPFDTVREGVMGVPLLNFGVPLHIESGAYPESMVIDRTVVLRAENGTVVVGGM